MPVQLNILLLMTDQQRWDTIHALGNAVIRTPNMDRLVHEGTAYTACYTPSPVCVSARCALLTGLPPHVTGCVNNMPMPQDVPSLMERLQARGYQTHGVGKMHFTPDKMRLWGFDSRDISEEAPPLEKDDDDFFNFVLDNGYDHVHEPHGIRSDMYYVPQPSQLPAHLHNTAWVADRSIDFIEQRDKDRPFFMWSSFIKPHPPFETPTPWSKLYRAPEMLPPFRPDGFESLLTYWNHHQNRYKYRGSGYDEMLVRMIRAAYYACITFIDHHVGRILDALATDLDNTLVIFTSDHGEMLGDYGSFGKRSMHNAGARVPLLVRLPGQFAAGEQVSAPTTLLDIFPTTLAAAGDDQPQAHPEGVNLAEPIERDIVYSHLDRGNLGLYMAATEGLKYIYSAADDQEWLFDLQADPQERHNFAYNPAYAERTEAMRQRLIERFLKDGYTEPIKDNAWWQYPRKTVHPHQDAGLLYQDPHGLDDIVSDLKQQLDERS